MCWNDTNSARRAWVESAHSDYLATLEPVSSPGELNLSQAMRAMREGLTDDAILTNGAGNFAVWAHRFFPFRGYRTQLAPTSGATGCQRRLRPSSRTRSEPSFASRATVIS